MKKQFISRIDIVNDAIQYYWGNPERQCKTATGVCSYVATDTSEGCAIGRLIDPDLAMKLPVESLRSYNDVFWMLPEWLQDFGFEFLKNLQACHDSSVFVNRDKALINFSMRSYVNLKDIIYPEE